MATQDTTELYTHQNSVVKLHGRGILKEVGPGGRVGEQVWRDPPVGHLGPRVVHQPGVQSRHEGSRQESEEYERGDAVGAFL